MVLSLRAVGPLSVLAITSLGGGCQVKQRTTAPRSVNPGAEELAAAYLEHQAPCQAGSVDACVNLGRAGLEHGGLNAGVPWLIAACDLEPQACVALGDAVIGRRANASDPKLAALAYRRACEAEHSGACYELAVLYYLGLGVAVDDPLSADLHHAACDGGIPEGCAYLVFLYDRGFGVQASATTSAYFREVACDRGYIDMCRGREPSTPTVPEPPASETTTPSTAPPSQGAQPVRTKPRRPVRLKPAGTPEAED
ncbi:MAG: hypothetical protein AAGA54_05140 [Myxococcota bacterium]